MNEERNKVQTVHVGFNKLTKAHCSSVTGMKLENLDTKYYEWVAVEFNPTTHMWKGDKDVGSVVSYGEVLPVESESNMNATCHQKIKKKYMYFDQINILSGLMEELITNGVLDKKSETVQDFLEMRDYIGRTRKNNVRMKEAISESEFHEYVTLDEEFRAQGRCLQGGLQGVSGRPLYGPPEY